MHHKNIVNFKVHTTAKFLTLLPNTKLKRNVRLKQVFMTARCCVLWIAYLITQMSISTSLLMQTLNQAGSSSEGATVLV